MFINLAFPSADRVKALHVIDQLGVKWNKMRANPARI